MEEYDHLVADFEVSKLRDEFLGARSRVGVLPHQRCKIYWDIVSQQVEERPITCVSLPRLLYVHSMASHLLGTSSVGYIREKNLIKKSPDLPGVLRFSRPDIFRIIAQKDKDTTRSAEIIRCMWEILLSSGVDADEIRSKIGAVVQNQRMEAAFVHQKSRENLFFSSRMCLFMTHAFLTVDVGLPMGERVKALLTNVLDTPPSIIQVPGDENIKVGLSNQANYTYLVKVDTRAILSELRLATTSPQIDIALKERPARFNIDAIGQLIMSTASKTQSGLVQKLLGYGWTSWK